MYIDTHTHFNSEEFSENLPLFIANAKDAGVDKMIIVGWDVESSERAVKIANQYSFLYAAVGFHPENLNGLAEDAFAQIKKIASNQKVVAIGEIGLDYYWTKDEDARAKQRKYFIRQIKIANELNKPIIVHSRDASEDTFEIINEYRPTKNGVMHCYSGSPEMALNYVKLGMFISLAGPVTFKNARVPKDVAAIVPLKSLLIETDCPYLAPHPFRGKLNESKYLPYIAEVIAEIKNIDVEDIAEWTTRNAERLFGI